MTQIMVLNCICTMAHWNNTLEQAVSWRWLLDGRWSLRTEYSTSVFSSECRMSSDGTLTSTGCWQDLHGQPLEEIIDAKKSDQWCSYWWKHEEGIVLEINSMTYSHITAMIRRTRVSSAEVNKTIQIWQSIKYDYWRVIMYSDVSIQNKKMYVCNV